MAVDRTISSGSVGRIDEERDDNLGVFDMEEMGDHDGGKEKRNSYGWSYANSTRSPNLAAVSKPRNGTGGAGFEGLSALR